MTFWLLCLFVILPLCWVVMKLMDAQLFNVRVRVHPEILQQERGSELRLVVGASLKKEGQL